MNLFTVIAGKSDNTFKLGGVTFEAAPVALDEYAEYLSLPQLPPDAQGNPRGTSLEVQAGWLADKLRRRIHSKDPDPATITPDWVMKNTPVPYLPILQHILLYGEMPDGGGQKKA